MIRKRSIMPQYASTVTDHVDDRCEGVKTAGARILDTRASLSVDQRRSRGTVTDVEPVTEFPLASVAVHAIV
jgi:hypothetical protein